VRILVSTPKTNRLAALVPPLGQSHHFLLLGDVYQTPVANIKDLKNRNEAAVVSVDIDIL
jgi:hypothetical protein